MRDRADNQDNSAQGQQQGHEAPVAGLVLQSVHGAFLAAS